MVDCSPCDSSSVFGTRIMTVEELLSEELCWFAFKLCEILKKSLFFYQEVNHISERLNISVIFTLSVVYYFFGWMFNHSETVNIHNVGITC